MLNKHDQRQMLMLNHIELERHKMNADTAVDNAHCSAAKNGAIVRRAEVLVDFFIAEETPERVTVEIGECHVFTFISICVWACYKMSLQFDH